MAAADLAQIPEVDIDSDGVFKYVLIRVHAAPPSGAPASENKEIVRGYKWAEYHADIYDKVSGELQRKGFDCECLGGGRISHQSQARKIHVYGYSMVSPGPGAGACALGGPGRLRVLQEARCRACSTASLQGFGRAQHSVSTEKIRAKYPDYEVTWADDGY
ncbi:14 kDa phosphohistidine phosphatase [Galemys pyrenaicus]|uniref:14 kDa phosphohistidine phosphatase n=1 Tax=Galemys pyrenaicus TaxID=202257 RepID=A0A8J6AH33_GALPY|nr:14 kDa phosphohistidine phosphatase [Galemys pyrenaicus]